MNKDSDYKLRGLLTKLLIMRELMFAKGSLQELVVLSRGDLREVIAMLEEQLAATNEYRGTTEICKKEVKDGISCD